LFRYTTNSSYALITSDGTRYDFDSSYKPTTIRDRTRLNTITFTYTDNKITTITDTVGRTASLSYDGNGKLSTLTYGEKTITYSYQAGAYSGYQLVSVSDPLGRKTNYTYYKDYLPTRIDYPTGGYTAYDYNTYDSGDYYRHRVKSQTRYDGDGGYLICNYVYTGGYSAVQKTKVIEQSDGTARKTTIMEYPSETSKTETVYNGTVSEGLKVFKETSTLYSNKQRKVINYYPGDNAASFDTTIRYDNWGNLVYSTNDYGYEKYYSYENTDTSDKFVNYYGTQIYVYSDSFYSNTVAETIHNLRTGQASLQDGIGSNKIEKYYQYDSNGNLLETKSLKEGSWINNSYTYDTYGNLLSSTDANNNTIYYTYDQNHAYLIETRQPLNLTHNIITSFGYDQISGELINTTNPNGNTYEYSYDKLGRITESTNPPIGAAQTSKEAVYNDTVTYTSHNAEYDSVATGTSSWLSPQSFISEGRTWVFTYNNSYIQFTSSRDGDNWESQVNVPESNYEAHWGMHYDGEYLHLVFTRGTAETDLFYKRGNPSPDGTITWNTKALAVETYYNCAHFPTITVTDKYVWVFYERYADINNRDPYVTCSSNMNGGWTTRPWVFISV
jgi:YD repeat-containing protein